MFLKLHRQFLPTPKTLNPVFTLSFYSHFDLKKGFSSFNSTPIVPQNTTQSKVAIFWDLDNKPPKTCPPFEAAVKLKRAAASFGIVRHMVAYANRRTLTYVPPVIREQRRDRKYLNQIENKVSVKPIEYLCRVCGRRFHANEKLVSHFKQIHEPEYRKRMNQIESARGRFRVKLVAKYSMKMDKYKNAARDVLTPKVGYGLDEELKRAGFWVGTVSDKSQAADIALRSHIVDVMDKRKAECLVIVSDDSDFVEVLKEARMRCLKTVVVGDINDGALKRAADTSFSWKEILMGKVKNEAVKVVGKWKDRDVLKRLEWTYDPDEHKGSRENEGCDDFSDSQEADFIKGDGGAWWQLDSDVDVRS